MQPEITPFRNPLNTPKKFTQNKKTIAKKKIHADKASGKIESHTPELPPPVFVQDPENLALLVTEVIHGPTVKTLHCLSLKTGETREVSIPSKSSSTIPPVIIGDKILLENNAVLGVVERKNLLARKKGDAASFSLHKRSQQLIAANLDHVIVVASARSPKFQPGFIDRYLLLAASCAIPAIICISKCDLAKLDDPILDWYVSSMNTPVFFTSSSASEGIESLKEFIQGKTVVFAGKSGVGKSSLVNAILGEEITLASSVSEKGDQGQHTTTSSKMYEWAKESYIVDTPGIRSLDFLEFSKEDIPLYFPDISPFAANCRYRDCLHDQETDCAVKDAVYAGGIPEMRYDTYIRLLGEA